MNNLSRARISWMMGWAATFIMYGLEYQILSFSTNKEIITYIDQNGYVLARTTKFLNRVKITGYKYAGELAGSENISDQYFRVKRGGRVGKAVGDKLHPHAGDARIMWSDDISNSSVFHKSELEPYFE